MASIARPFGAVLLFLYNIVNNYGLALILFAIVIRIILLPFQMKAKRGQMRQARLQPKMAELQKKHGTNKAKINEEMAKLYRDEGVNPASGCLWGILPLPIMFALFLVIREPLTMMLGLDPLLIQEGGPIYTQLANMRFENPMQAFYVQVAQAQYMSEHWTSFSHFADFGLRQIDFSFLGINLGNRPQWDFLWNPNLEFYGNWFSGFLLFLLPLVSAGSQFLATAINRKINPAGMPDAAGGGQMKTFMMLMPLMSVYFGFIVPGALSLYWTTGTLLQIVQDIVLTKRYTRIIDAEDAVKNEERKKKEAELEAKRVETERKKAEGQVEQNPNTSKRKKQKSSKQDQLEKATEWQKKNAPAPAEDKYEPSREGNRRYARGRAYDPERFLGAGGSAAGESGEEYEDSRVELLDFEPDEDELDENELDGDDDDAGDDSEPDDDEDDDDEDDDDDSDGEGEDGGDDDGSSTTHVETRRYFSEE